MDHNYNSKPNESAGQETDLAADDREARDDGAGAASDASRRARPPKRSQNELVEWIKALAIAGVLVLVIRWFLVSPFIVDGPSMEPNFWNRERIIVNKIIYDIRKPKRGEVIVFHVPQEGRDFIKRVIALPGETVKVDGDQIYINGEPLAETYLQGAYDKAHSDGVLYNRYDGDRSNFPNSSFPDGVVPEGTVFVMGDNRPNSEDSRMIGYVSVDEIVGRADLIFWPIKDFKLVKH